MNDKNRADVPDFIFTDGESKPWCASAMAAGVEVKDMGAANGRSMQLVRFPPGTHFPVHEHEGPEFVYVLEGELIQNGRRMRRGWACVAAAGTTDTDVKSETGCIFLIIYSE